MNCFIFTLHLFPPERVFEPETNCTDSVSEPYSNVLVLYHIKVEVRSSVIWQSTGTGTGTVRNRYGSETSSEKEV